MSSQPLRQAPRTSHRGPRHTLTLAFGICALHAAHVHAQELSFLGGVLAGDTGNNSYSWALDYQEGLGR